MGINHSILKSIIIALVILLYGYFGYYPIHPVPMLNNGAVLTIENVLKFQTMGIAYSKDFPDWLIEGINNSSFDITLDLETEVFDQTTPARILTILTNTIFVVNQEGTDLIMFLRARYKTPKSAQKFIVPNIFVSQRRHVIRISVKPGELKVSVDGELRLNTLIPTFMKSSQPSNFLLTLGNRNNYDRPWLGVIYKASICVNDRCLDYLKSGDLELPRSYFLKYRIQRINFVPFYRELYNVYAFQDWAVNFIGFIPLGLIFSVIYQKWSTIWRIMIISLGVSLIIETMQIFLPWRTPGMDDLILNTLGGATGAWVGLYIGRFNKLSNNLE